MTGFGGIESASIGGRPQQINVDAVSFAAQKFIPDSSAPARE
jgi:hypothetical protein